MLEMHLRQPEFTYSTCRAFIKNKEIIQKFKQTGDSRYIYKKKKRKKRKKIKLFSTWHGLWRFYRFN